MSINSQSLLWTKQEAGTLDESLDVAQIECAEVDGKIYCFKGYLQYQDGNVGPVYIFDPVAQEWSEGPMMISHYRIFTCVAYGRQIFCAGIWDGMETHILVLDTVTGTWEVRSRLPICKNEFKIALVEDRIYCFGGIAIPGNLRLRDVDIYHIPSDTWSKGREPSNTNTGVSQYDAVVMGDKIYYMGGYRGASQDYNDCMLYDAKADQWQQMSRMPHRTVFSGGAYIRGSVYCISTSPPWSLQILKIGSVAVTTRYLLEDGPPILEDLHETCWVGEDRTTNAKRIGCYLCTGYQINGGKLTAGNTATLEAYVQSNQRPTQYHIIYI